MSLVLYLKKPRVKFDKMRIYNEIRNKCDLAVSIIMIIANVVMYYTTFDFCKPLINLMRLYFILDMYGHTNIFRFHHCIVLLAMTLILNCDQPDNMLSLWANMEISTIFLSMYYITKKDIYKIIFIPTFFYFRIFEFVKYIYFSDNFHNDSALICINNQLPISYEICYNTVKLANYSLFGINIYWFYEIAQKIRRRLTRQST